MQSAVTMAGTTGIIQKVTKYHFIPLFLEIKLLYELSKMLSIYWKVREV